ncbi:MAG: molybdopterin-guanine dinucleotide biosynthesis protein B [Candidatus Thorarchaeota archaeon]|jgi:molybdopterin-guanine dinucleotide biosynthesis protein B
MRVFAVAGYSSTGKTTLVEALIRELTRRGYSVSTIKSTNEDVKDMKDSDTERHRLAGAKTTMLVGPELIMIQSRRPSSLKEVLSSIQGDLLLIEGMKEKPIPKIWCIGKNELPKALPDGVLAIYTWDRSPIGIEGQMISRYTIEQIGELADLIETASIDLTEIDL